MLIQISRLNIKKLWDARLMLKNAIVLAFFSCGCNQSQIFPRSGVKSTNLRRNKKRVI
jgi:hypothetical protein